MSLWADKLPDTKRFKLVLESEAVLDKETGLVWERSPNSPELLWNEAIIYCYKKSLGGRMGWRLPTVEEFLSLVDPAQNTPGLPNGHPFSNISGHYWTATTVVNAVTMGWSMAFAHNSYLDTDLKLHTKRHVWCVRGGKGLEYYAFSQ